MVYGDLQSMIKSARAMDPSLAFFEVAESCFFRYSVAVNSRNARAWLNLALVHQCITGEYVELVMELVVGWWWYCCGRLCLLTPCRCANVQLRAGGHVLSPSHPT